MLATCHLFLHPSWLPRVNKHKACAGFFHSGGKAKTIYWLINENMAKSMLNQVLLENDFVLEPSNLIKNQRLVSYLNSIYNPMVEARTSNYLDDFLFLIANIYLPPK